MRSTSPNAQFCASLDPILTRVGFLAGQGTDTGQLIFCAASEDLAVSYPEVVLAVDSHPREGCTDLIIETNADGTVRSVDVEGLPLEALLRELGRAADADAILGLLRRPVEEGVPALRRVLQTLFPLLPRE